MVVSVAALFLPPVIAYYDSFFAFEAWYLILLFIFPPIIAFFSAWFAVNEDSGDVGCLLVIIMIILIALSGWCFYRLTNAPRQLQATVQEGIKNQTLPIVNRLRSASHIVYKLEGISPKQPSLLTVCDLNHQDTPNLKTIELAPNWFGALCKQLGRPIEKVRNFPSVEFKSITVFAQDYRKTGRMFKLDNGSVPELRHNVRIFVFDAATLNCIWRSAIIIGPPGEKPARRPGVHYYSAVTGEAIWPYVPDEAFNGK